MTVYSIGLFAALLVTAGEPQKADKELKKFEGTWEMVSGQQQGKIIPEEVVKTAKLVIKGNKHTVTLGDETIAGTHKVDPSKKPKTIDGMETEGPDKGKTVLGIYKLKKNRLTVCFAQPGKERPTKFTTKKGTGVILHVWKRVK